MKLFVAICSLMVAAASGQLRDPKSIDPKESRTRTCTAEDEPKTQGDALPPLQRGNLNPNAGSFATGQAARGLVGRGKRQAGDRFNPENTPFVWFTTNGETISKEECEDRAEKARAEEAEGTGKRIDNRGPIFVQRGVYDVCVKFNDAPTWFYTKGGTNAGCDPTLRCCEWFPPYNNPCSSIKAIFWYESLEGDCVATYDSLIGSKVATNKKAILGVEYIHGAKVGEARTVCHITNPIEFEKGEDPKIKQLEVEVTYCAEKCCIYEQV